MYFSIIIQPLLSNLLLYKPMGMAAPHCIAFVNNYSKCANDAKQEQRLRIAHVLNGKQKVQSMVQQHIQVGDYV